MLAFFCQDILAVNIWLGCAFGGISIENIEKTPVQMTARSIDSSSVAKLNLDKGPCSTGHRQHRCGKIQFYLISLNDIVPLEFLSWNEDFDLNDSLPSGSPPIFLRPPIVIS